MAGLYCNVNSGEVTLVAATMMTALQIKSAANHRVTLKKLAIFGKQAAGGTDTPIKVRITRSTANFGTAAGSAVAGKTDPAWAETVQTACGYGPFSVDPTTPTDSGIMFEVQPQSGVIDPALFGGELKIPGGNAINIELTSIATPTVLIVATFEE